jgi:hypothetical protein
VQIERLSFLVIPEERTDDFIDADAAVWNPWLQQQRGYIRKTAQVYPGGRVDLRIFWASKKDLEKASKDPQIPALDVKLQSQFLGVFQRLPT